MKIKHWQGYGTVSAVRIKDDTCTLHIRVEGSHEYGLYCDDEYTLHRWLVKRFDRSAPDVLAWLRRDPYVTIQEGVVKRDGVYVDTCDYLFRYDPPSEYC